MGGTREDYFEKVKIGKTGGGIRLEGDLSMLKTTHFKFETPIRQACRDTD